MVDEPLTVVIARRSPAKYHGDHHGDRGFRRSAADEQRWQELRGQAQALFGTPGDSRDGLTRAVRGGSQRLRLVQGTAAGVDEQVQAAGLSADELERVAVTSASGVHAGPLAEFALMVLLFARGLPRLEADRSAHRWDHYVTPE